jgi:hypothetical protein
MQGERSSGQVQVVEPYRYYIFNLFSQHNGQISITRYDQTSNEGAKDSVYTNDLCEPATEQHHQKDDTHCSVRNILRCIEPECMHTQQATAVVLTVALALAASSSSNSGSRSNALSHIVVEYSPQLQRTNRE